LEGIERVQVTVAGQVQDLITGLNEVKIKILNVAPTEPWSPCKPPKVRLPRHQASAKAWRSSSV
jgi:hypothetical protein